MALPVNLFVAGAAKSATSTLHDHLDRHPDVVMSDPKEPHYFSGHWRGGRAAYEALFDAGRDRAYRGESSTGYGAFPGVAERIAAETVAPRILFVLRNPIDRAWSHYWWLRRLGQERRPFDEAFRADQGRDADPADPVRGTGNFRYYHAYGRYGTMLRRYLAVFDPAQIWVAEFSDLVTAPGDTMQSCFAFLGLAVPDAVAAVHANPTRPLRHPRVARAVEVLGTLPGLRTVRGRAPAGLKRAVMGPLRRPGEARGYPPAPAAVRRRLAAVYAPEVAGLRERWPGAGRWWVPDFPR